MRREERVLVAYPERFHEGLDLVTEDEVTKLTDAALENLIR